MSTIYGHQEDANGNLLLPTTHSMATVELGSNATQPYAKGDLVIWNNRLCQATRAISANDAFAINTNLQYTTMNAQLNNIKVYVNSNGDLVYRDHTGADSVLNFSQIYDLGTGQSFNCTGIPNYHNLTNSNFFVNQGNISVSRISPAYDMNAVSASSSIYISYNSSSGILTSYLRMSGNDSHQGGGSVPWNTTANVHAYCVTHINNIRTL